MPEYYLELRDECGSTETVELLAANAAAAVQAINVLAYKKAKTWVAQGDWGDEGASVAVNWRLTDNADNELADGYETISVEPDHESLIAQLGYIGSCGDDPDDHDWTSEGEGGCTENPGVWSTGGTSMMFRSHCRDCGLIRVEKTTGPQRNPGDHDTAEYYAPEDA